MQEFYLMRVLERGIQAVALCYLPLHMPRRYALSVSPPRTRWRGAPTSAPSAHSAPPHTHTHHLQLWCEPAQVPALCARLPHKGRLGEAQLRGRRLHAGDRWERGITQDDDGGRVARANARGKGVDPEQGQGHVGC